VCIQNKQNKNNFRHLSKQRNKLADKQTNNRQRKGRGIVEAGEAAPPNQQQTRKKTRYCRI
jgi:hypothetical protein